VSVKQALLALLEEQPMYGYQLRHEFERRTGSTWPLNVGQVYTTLARLERDGLVESAGPADESGQVVYRLTGAGREEVAAWFTTPVERSRPPRDELAIKLALAVTVPGVDVGTVIQRQRGATMTALQDYTRLGWPGAWCWTRWSSPPRPRSVGWTTVRPAYVGLPRSAARPRRPDSRNVLASRPRHEPVVEPVRRTGASPASRRGALVGGVRRAPSPQR
jgi:DNA-binding PadR family transcriptional regulator